MTIYELEKLADCWRRLDSLDFYADWPRNIPKKNRTLAYMDKCKVASFDFDRHCRDNLIPLLRAARKLLLLVDGDESRYEAWKKEIEDLRKACVNALEVDS